MNSKIFSLLNPLINFNLIIIFIFTIIFRLTLAKIANDVSLCKPPHPPPPPQPLPIKPTFSPPKLTTTTQLNNNDNPIVANPVCRQPKDRGNLCKGINGNETKIKWYFDKETLQCLAFGYNGCGGNENKFSSIFECREKCPLPMDFGGCSGNKPSARNSKGEQIFCGGHPGLKIEMCPTGFQCRGMAFYSICCDIENEELYNKNFNPKCADGKRPHQIFDERNNYNITYLGKSCSDQFCPLNTKCVELEIFSHCCE
uniref:BPTI/Kunitz inhibitor domain-containing protein n=1 Tax=Meloidogyne incognita TaxID=6306 RepID=A0A914LUX9_MELIC